MDDVDFISKCAPFLAEKILAKGVKVDAIFTAETKGIPVAYETAKVLGHDKYFVARKRLKNYMGNAIKAEVNSITTRGTQTLFLDEKDANLMKGKNICILDDVMSTGESLAALETLVTKAGGNIVARVCILAEGDAIGREDISYLQELPLFTKIADGEYEIAK